MPITAELHDGRTLEFPDGTDPLVVQRTVKKMLGAGTGAVIPPSKDVAPPAETPLETAAPKSFWEHARGVADTARVLANSTLSAPLSLPILAAREITGNKTLGQDALAKLVPPAQTPVGRNYTQDVGRFAQENGPALIGPAGDLLGQLFKASQPARQMISDADKVPTGTYQGIQSLTESAAQKLMQSAIKPTLDQLRNGDAKIAINTLLERGLNPTQGGADKLRVLIDEKNQQIKNLISQSDKTIPKSAVIDPIAETRSKFGRQVNPTPDINAIDRVVNDFDLTNPGQIPIQRAQDLKTGTYQALRGKYGELGSAETEAQKTLARGLRQQIGEAIPEVVPLNAEEAQLLKTLSVTERRALLELNKNPIGLSWLSHNPATFAAYMADKSALFKSLAARTIYKMGQFNDAPRPMAPTSSIAPEALKAQLNQNWLGDLTPEWTTGLGAGNNRASGIEPTGLVKALGEDPPLPQGIPQRPGAQIPAFNPAPLGDLTPDWGTSLGANPKPSGISAEGLVRALGEDPLVSSRNKSRPQMPVQPGLPGVDDVAINGGLFNTWTDAAPGALDRMRAAPMAVGGIELSRIVNMPKSAKRTKLLMDFRARYPVAHDYIDDLIKRGE